jgi:hypothetical protein
MEAVVMFKAQKSASLASFRLSFDNEKFTGL